jgi:tRNA(fMet)-specific endonuclease VapC
MTSYVLDTNIVSLILRRNASVNRRFNQVLTPDNLILGCPAIWYELRCGLLARDAKVQMQRFEALFATFEWQDYDSADWHLAATLWLRRRALGIPVGDADLLIGVFARNRNAVLVTDNEKDFVNLDVVVENWTKLTLN